MASHCATPRVNSGSDILLCFNPLMSIVAMWDTAVKQPVPDRVKPSFVIFDIRAL